MYMPVHGFACQFSAGDRIDRKACAVVYVTACEDILLGSLEGNRIGLDRAVAVDFNRSSLKQVSHDNGLTDGKENILCGEFNGLVLVILRVETMFCVKYAGALLEYDTGDPAVLGKDFLRSPAVAYFDAFFLRLSDFIIRRRHFIGAFQAQHRDFSVRNALGSACNVNRDISAADDNDITLEANRVVKIDAAQEFDTGFNTLSIFARNTGHSAALHADGDDLAFVTVSLVDKDGTFVPTATDQLRFEVEGAGRFRAVCNGDATSLEPFTEPTMRLFAGQLVVVVQAAREKGTLTLRVVDEQRGLNESVDIEVK
jgi:hypothetical protein